MNGSGQPSASLERDRSNPPRNSGFGRAATGGAGTQFAKESLATIAALAVLTAGAFGVAEGSTQTTPQQVALAFSVPGASVIAAGPTQHHESLTTSQILKGIASVSDPGLPAIVGSVDGVAIRRKLLAKAEYGIWSNTGAEIGTTAIRSQAFDELVVQQLELEAARSLDLLPSMAVARKQAIARRLPLTMTELRAIREEDGISALAHKIMAAAQGESATGAATIGQGSNPITGSGTSAWNAYVTSLVTHANVQVYAKF